MTTRTTFLASIEKDLFLLRNWTRGRTQTTSYFRRWWNSIPWCVMVFAIPAFLAYSITSTMSMPGASGMLATVFMIPTLMVIAIWGDFFRSTWRNLRLNWLHGAANIRIDRANYRPGDVVEVELLSRQSRNTALTYKVELNYVLELNVSEAEGRGLSRRTVQHSFPITTVSAPRLADGISLTIPREVNDEPLYSLINDEEGTRYWEVLITQPEGPFYARAILEVWLAE